MVMRGLVANPRGSLEYAASAETFLCNCRKGKTERVQREGETTDHCW